MKEKKLLVIKDNRTAILVNPADRLSSWIGDGMISVVAEMEIEHKLSIGDSINGRKIIAISETAILTKFDIAGSSIKYPYEVLKRFNDGNYIEHNKYEVNEYEKAVTEFICLGLGMEIKQYPEEKIDMLIKAVEELR